MFALVRRGDGTDVTFHDASVSRISIADQMTIDVKDHGGDTLRVVLGGPLEVRHGNGEVWSLCPDDDDDRLARLAFALRRSYLVICGTDARGTLSLVFEAGIAVRVAPQASDEAWSLLHDGFELVGTAAGEFATIA